MTTRCLITGMAGFLGSHICEHVLRTNDWELVSLDRLDCSGNLNRLTSIDAWESEKRRVKILFHDLRAPISEQLSRQIGHVDMILHIAALTHVDRAIADPLAAVYDNVVATAHILEFARQCENLQWFYYQSTDEVFGKAPEGIFWHEWDRYHASNPYSAAKAGGEELCLAYHTTYKLPVLICHTMNLIGQKQHREKYLPSTVYKILHGEEVQVHAYPDLQRAGSRFYLHARNMADAILFLLQHGEAGEKYNAVGEREVDNLELAERVSTILRVPLKFKLVDAHSQRSGHDPRYALSGEKMASMGWKPPVSFDASLEKTVLWFKDHPEWL